MLTLRPSAFRDSWLESGRCVSALIGHHPASSYSHPPATSAARPTPQQQLPFFLSEAMLTLIELFAAAASCSLCAFLW